MQCLICSGPTRPLFNAHGYDLSWCDDCEFGRLGGAFTPDVVRGFYSDDYYTHSIKGSSKPWRPTIAERALMHSAWRCDGSQDFSAAEFPLGKTACDIGCGNGNLLRRMKSAAYSVVGIEPDPKARAITQDFPVYDGTAEQLPEGLGQFDVVIMSHVLEHCIDPTAAVRNAKGLLTDSGTLVIEVPNNAALGFRWFQGKWPWTDIPRHLSFFAEKSLQRLLSSQGLRISKTIYTGFTRQFSPEWRQQIGSVRSGWPLLLRSVVAQDRSKYDSIRIHAKCQ